MSLKLDNLGLTGGRLKVRLTCVAWVVGSQVTVIVEGVEEMAEVGVDTTIVVGGQVCGIDQRVTLSISVLQYRLGSQQDTRSTVKHQL